MEIYQAAEEFNSLENGNDIGFCKHLGPWRALRHPDVKGWVITRNVCESMPLDDMALLSQRSNTYLDYYMFIEKQRGGWRVFKSLDAVANAVRQIGQSYLEVEL